MRLNLKWVGRGLGLRLGIGRLWKHSLLIIKFILQKKSCASSLRSARLNDRVALSGEMP